MDDLARWMGLKKAINYTNKIAWFYEEMDELVFVSHVRDFDPRTDPKLFILLIDHAIDEGAEITIHRKAQKTSKFLNIAVVMSIKNQIYRGIGMNFRTATVNCIQNYVKNLNHEISIQSDKN